MHWAGYVAVGVVQLALLLLVPVAVATAVSVVVLVVVFVVGFVVRYVGLYRTLPLHGPVIVGLVAIHVATCVAPFGRVAVLVVWKIVLPRTVSFSVAVSFAV